MDSIQSAQWLRSSYCGTNACVEVAEVSGQFLVRDSKNLAAAPLSFTREEWAAFVRGVKANEFGGE